MKALLLNGFAHQNSDSERVSAQITEELQNHGYTVDSILLAENKVAYCQGCFGCWVNSPGKCKIQDFGQVTAQKMIESSLIIHFTPITFGGYSYDLKKVIDRFLPTITPFITKRKGELHHIYRYKQRASIIAVGMLDNPDEEKEAIFKELAYRMSLNMGGPINEAFIITKNQDSEVNMAFAENFRQILQQVEGTA